MKEKMKEEYKWAIAPEVGIAEAERLANIAADLYEELKNRKVMFRFLKKDGSTREAFGTLCEDFLPPVTKQETSSDNTERKSNYSVMCYYDLEKSSWRSFRVANLIDFE